MTFIELLSDIALPEFRETSTSIFNTKVNGGRCHCRARPCLRSFDPREVAATADAFWSLPKASQDALPEARLALTAP